MDLDCQQYINYKVIYIDEICYLSAINIILAEIYICVITSIWCFYGIEFSADSVIELVCSIVMLISIKLDFSVLDLSKSYICKG